MLGLLGIGIIPASLFLCALWFGEGHGASLSRLDRVQIGMTGKQVFEILGGPGTVNRADDGSESWYYTRGTFCQVKVYLDGDGRVEGTDHDH